MWHKKTLEDLAYFRIRDTIAGFCAGEESQELLKTKLPFTETEKIEELKNLITRIYHISRTAYDMGLPRRA